VLLVDQLPYVNPMALVLACFHPVFETLFSIWRRWRKCIAISRADRLHFHSLVMRRIVRPVMGCEHQHAANAITGLICSALTAVSAILAVLTATDEWTPLLALLLMSLVYLSLYARMVRFHWCSPWVLFMQPTRTHP
jgi:UDP-N-acetylmuramyl pentapeptide phosphotransferase/UDP-N-acetylglucosamine-1-phosphate transferase